ncbi:MAG: hemolysin III family protein [Clostridia bacterium]|nr:hemolysin III family protein [Clostridia bacterium]
MRRTKLIDRILPDYTSGEEIFNMVTHIVGGGLGVVYLVLCVVFAAIKGNVWGVVSTAIYGASVICLFTMSSVYHGVRVGMGKKVLQVLDHCTIYFMIAGTYTPIMLSLLRKTQPVTAWVVFGIVWGIAALATTFTAIDLKKYNVLSMICYLGMGWCVIFTIVPVYRALTFDGFMWLLGGGIMYTIGAVLYGIGAKKRYIHSVFHIFVVLASIMHFLCIFFYCI